MCKPGYCANSQGKCEQRQGNKLGTFAIRFLNAYQKEEPYLGVEKGKWPRGDIRSTANSERQWILVQTPDGFVRFENIHTPGEALKFHRHVTLALIETNETETAGSNVDQHLLETRRHQSWAAVPDNDHLYPEMGSLGEPDLAKPAEISFQVRQILGKGLEIFDPYQKVSLASAKKGGWFKDDIADLGVAECYPESVGLGSCEGHEIIAFEPELPAGVATAGAERQYRAAPGTDHPFLDSALRWVACVLCIVGLALVAYIFLCAS